MAVSIDTASLVARPSVDHTEDLEQDQLGSYYFTLPDRHNSYLQECIGLYDQSFHYLAHDIRLLLLRFAYEKSFSAESGGGGPQSNLLLIPYLMHIALHVINT